MVPASFVTRVHLIWNQLSYLAAVAHKECYRAIIWLMIIWMLFEAYCIIGYHNLIPFKIIYDVNDRSSSKVILSVFETYDHKIDMETISHWCTWCTCLRLLPARVYPHRFARAVLDIVETLKATCRGQPQITHGQTPLATETMQLTWDHDKDLWEFVDFEELFVYLRGSKNLRIPDCWKDIIPRRIPK